MISVRTGKASCRKLFLNFACPFMGLLVSAALAQAQVTPLPLAHSHNDYEHKRPLLDALDRGFCSIEADVWLVDGNLLVAHNKSGVRNDRTLQSLYLDPLRERVEKNGGRVYAGGPPVTLLIDFKSEAADTYRALVAAIKPYEKMLTVFHPDRIETNAVTIILSGNSPRDLLKAEPVRRASYDGRLNELDSAVPPTLMPLVSDTWAKYFKWRGKGPLSAEEREKLKKYVEKTHQQGKRIRFWAIPDGPDCWSELLAAGVDVIGTDHLDELRDFFAARAQSSAK
jgi:hypothetical protein